MLSFARQFPATSTNWRSPRHSRRNNTRAKRRLSFESLEPRQLLAAFDVLVFSKTTGFRHDSIAAGIQAIQQLGAANDFSVVATEDATAFNTQNLAQFEAVVFLNTTGDILNATQQAAFEAYIEGGGGFVGTHSAADTEYDWPWYGQLVGAYFQSHPQIQAATIKVADKVHPSTIGLPDRWMRTDEWYNYRINPRGTVHVLGTLDETTYNGGTMGFDHPITWCQNIELGRSWYTGLGHTTGTYSETLYRQHLLGGIRFAAGAAAGDAGATVNTNYTKVVLDDETLDPMQLDVAADGRVFYVERGELDETTQQVLGAVKAWNPATQTTSVIGRIPVVTSGEDGLLGIALDPQFATNQWLYVFYSAVGAAEQHISRFTVVNGQLDLTSERILLRVPVQRDNSNHSGGALGFGPGGLLYAALGDNTSPFASDGYAPIDERPGRSDWDAQKSSANTNDLRGKILRIKPEPDGTYSIPAGNLFPANGSQGRPEIYVMGNRNPFRFSVDSETGWLYWGEVGPDASVANPLRGPAGHDEWNQARTAGNFGWPYIIANNQAYRDFNFQTGQSGPAFNPAAPQNNSPNNTGSLNLPPARPALIWYTYAASAQFPELGTGGRTAMSGPVYHFAPGSDSQRKLPAYYDDTLFIYEWSRNWIKEVKLDAAGNVLKINPFLPNMTFRRPMDMKIGPDGAIYMLEWGSDFGGGNADSQLIRIDYKAPTTTIGLTATALSPNRVRLTWTDVWTNETGIRVERSTDGVNFATLVDLPPNTTSYEDAGLQSFVTYSYRVRALMGQTPTSPSNVATATPELVTIVGTAGNDTYHVVRAGSQIHIHENKPPTGQPTYRAELALMTRPLTIDSGAGNDSLTVNSGGQPTLGLSLLNYAAGAGDNTLELQSGSARVDSTATGGVLNTEVDFGAQLTTARFLQNGLTLQGAARAVILAGGAPPSLLTTITFAPASGLDLNDNDLIYNTTPAAKVALFNTLSNRLRTGYADGEWDGTGISSTSAAGNTNTTVGLVDNAVLSLSQFGGVTVDENALLLKYTYYGDIDLNGRVDGEDLTVFAINFGRTTGATHVDGDIDFNGTVDGEDLTVFANNFGRGIGAPLGAGEKYEIQRTKDEVPVAAPDGSPVLAPAQAPSNAPPRATAGSSSNALSDDALLDLLAEAIAAELTSGHARSLTDRRLASSRDASAPCDLWASAW